MRKVLSAVLGLLFICVPVVVLAETFDIRGHEVNVDWEHGTNAENQDVFIIRGKATKGKPCKNLEIQFAFSSDYYKENVPVAKAYIESYDPEKWNDFEGQVVVKTEKEHIPSWGFIDSAVKCLE